MSRKKQVIGNCKICGTYGQLTYEHVPPESAFNKGRFYYTAEMDKILKLGDEDFDILTLKDKKHTRKMQGGVGFYTLCKRCNNNTGLWYGAAFAEWVYQCMSIIVKSNRKPTLYYPTFIYPLRIIKQIISMFFSIKHDYLRNDYEYLVRFVLNKEEKYLPPQVKIFVYYNIEGSNRYIGDIVIGSFNNSNSTLVSEISFPPLGFVMTLDGTCPDQRLTDISSFSEYGYNQWIDHFQKFATLPTYLPFFPTDYRSKDEIVEGMAEGIKAKHTR